MKENTEPSIKQASPVYEVRTMGFSSVNSFYFRSWSVGRGPERSERKLVIPVAGFT
jgi:hypothetical protein